MEVGGPPGCNKQLKPARWRCKWAWCSVIRCSFDTGMVAAMTPNAKLVRPGASWSTVVRWGRMDHADAEVLFMAGGVQTSRVAAGQGHQGGGVDVRGRVVSTTVFGRGRLTVPGRVLYMRAQVSRL